MAGGIETDKIFAAFYADEFDEISRFGIDTGKTETLDAAFSIPGLVKAISATYHLAKWEMVVLEERLVGGTKYEFGFDLTAGPPGKETKLRYFPEVWTKEDSFCPKQSARMYLTGGGEQSPRLYDRGLVIESCEVKGSFVVFHIKQSRGESGLIPTAISILTRDGSCGVIDPRNKVAPEKPTIFQPSLFPSS